MVVKVKFVSECQHNVGNYICVNRFYYKNYNGPINQLIERHNAQIFLKSLVLSRKHRKARKPHKSKSKAPRKALRRVCEDCKDFKDGTGRGGRAV